MDKFLIRRAKVKEESFVMQNKPSDHQEEQEPGSKVGFQIMTMLRHRSKKNLQ